MAEYSGPVPPGGWQQPTPRPAGLAAEGNTEAILALVLGIAGVIGALFTFGVLGVLLGVPAIVLGVLGRRKVTQGRTMQYGGLATGGLVTGIIAILTGVVIIALVALGIAFLTSGNL